MSYFSPCSQTFKWSEGRFTSAAHINVDITEQINSKCFTAKGKSIQTYMYNFHPQLKQEKKTRTEKESAFERGCSCGRSCQAVLVQRKRGTDGTPDISVRTTESSHLTLHTQKKKGKRIANNWQSFWGHCPFSAWFTSHKDPLEQLQLHRSL